MITPREETWEELLRTIALNTRSIHCTFLAKFARLLTKDRKKRADFYWANRDVRGWAHWIQEQKGSHVRH